MLLDRPRRGIMLGSPWLTEPDQAHQLGLTQIGPTGNVTIRLTGFEDYAGMTIRARLGALSGTVVSGVIQADGTAVLILNSIFTILNSTYFESYVDEDGSGSCNPLFDHLAAANIILQRDGDNYEAELDESDTSAGITGCFVLN